MLQSLPIFKSGNKAMNNFIFCMSLVWDNWKRVIKQDIFNKKKMQFLFEVLFVAVRNCIFFVIANVAFLLPAHFLIDGADITSTSPEIIIRVVSLLAIWAVEILIGIFLYQSHRKCQSLQGRM